MLLFTNATIDVAQLPRAEEAPLQPLNPKYLQLLRVEWLLWTAVLILGTAALLFFAPSFQKAPTVWLLPAGIIVFVAYYYFMLHKTFPYKAYAVREHDVLYQKGWLVRSLKACPFNRIQNCTVQNGPLERKWGLASITLYTAGSNDLRIPGLTQTEANDLRQFILSRSNPHATHN